MNMTDVDDPVHHREAAEVSSELRDQERLAGPAIASAVRREGVELAVERADVDNPVRDRRR